MIIKKDTQLVQLENECAKHLNRHFSKKYMQIENKHVNYIEEQSIIRYQNAYQNN